MERHALNAEQRPQLNESTRDVAVEERISIQIELPTQHFVVAPATTTEVPKTHEIKSKVTDKPKSERWPLSKQSEGELSVINNFIDTNSWVDYLFRTVGKMNVVIRVAVGVVVSVVGLFMLVLPGPAFLVIPLGIGLVLGTKERFKGFMRGFYKFCDIFSTSTVERYLRKGRFTRKTA